MAKSELEIIDSIEKKDMIRKAKEEGKGEVFYDAWTQIQHLAEKCAKDINNKFLEYSQIKFNLLIGGFSDEEKKYLKDCFYFILRDVVYPHRRPSLLLKKILLESITLGDQMKKDLITEYNSRKYKVDTKIGRYTIIGKKDGRPSDYYCRNNKTNKIVVKASKELREERNNSTRLVEVFQHSWTAKEYPQEALDYPKATWNGERRSVVTWSTDEMEIGGTIVLDKRIINRFRSQVKKRLKVELEPEDLELDYIILHAVRSSLLVETPEEVAKIIGADKYFDHHVEKIYEHEETVS